LTAIAKSRSLAGASIHVRAPEGYRVSSTGSGLFGVDGDGDRAAADARFTMLYSELHRIARRELARQKGPFGLGPTTVLHQAYIDMAARDGTSFPDRARFMGYAARVMRGLIIDHARRSLAQKRGGGFEITTLPTEVADHQIDVRELSLISDALEELGKVDPALVEVVDMKFFCGFSFDEIAGIHKVSARTVRRQWEKARLYLHSSIRADLVP
jgi:RNA polymerase sigma factor (TIGR02999 family)